MRVISSTREHVERWAHEHGLRVEPIVEWWSERAAVREYMGNASRIDAEQRALWDDLVLHFAPNEHVPSMG